MNVTFHTRNILNSRSSIASILPHSNDTYYLTIFLNELTIQGCNIRIKLMLNNCFE